MANIDFKIGNISVRVFSSVCNFIIYLIDLLIRNVFLFLIIFTGIIHVIILPSNPEFSGFFFIYTLSAVIWGLLLIKFILVGGKTFGKSRYDLFFMGLLLITLISSLFSSYGRVSIFGSDDTWSYSILTFISISIVYYTAVILFSYLRGRKWLLLGFIVSLLIGSIIYSWWVVRQAVVADLSFISFCTYCVPLLIAAAFIFRKTVLKILSIIALLLSLFLISYYAQDISFELFALSLGIFIIILFYYLLFWVENIQPIKTFVAYNYWKLLRKGKKLNKKMRSSYQKGRLLILEGIVLAGITLILALIANHLYKDIGIDLIDRIKSDVGRVEGLKSWFIGENDLNFPFSQSESVNILANYGLITLAIYVSLFHAILYDTVKLTIQNIVESNLRSVIYFSTVLLVTVNLFIHFLFQRLDASLITLLIFMATISAVNYSVYKSYDGYCLLPCRMIKDKRILILRIAAIIVLFLLVIFGVLGLSNAVDKNLF